MSFLSVTVFLRGKNLHKDHLKSASQVVKEFTLAFVHHDLALSYNEKGKRHNCMALFNTPFIFIRSHFSKNEAISSLGVSMG